MRQTRREFLRSAGAAGVALAGASTFACEVKQEVPFEGIYTDKFTYTRGEPIRVFLSLQSDATVTVRLYREDTQFVHIVASVQARSCHFGRPDDAGVLGADFVVSAVIFTDSLEPGLYTVSIAETDLRPENLYNSYHAFGSRNDIARLVITNENPGSRSRILWVHDSLTGTAYGSFGGQSLYGIPPVERRTVSFARPGLEIATWNWALPRFLRQRGYEFEYIDLVALAAQSGSSLRAAYDLIVCQGQFEYVPTPALVAIDEFLRMGGNGFFAANEFAGWRVRLSSGSQMTTYRGYYQIEDPLYGVPGAERDVAGTGMTIPGGPRETEVTGNTLWAAARAVPGAWADSPLYIGPETSWLVEGTGVQDGDVLPAAFTEWASGTLIGWASGRPFVLPSEHTGVPPVTHVWSAFPSSNGIEWWNWNGEPNFGAWPQFNGYATALYQQRESGGQVITLPSQDVANRFTHPIYERLLLNIFQRLT
jgi:hypothetical protein